MVSDLMSITAGYKKQFIEDIIEGMSSICDNSQLMELNKSLNKHTAQLIISENPDNHDLNYDKTNKVLIDEFVKVKKLKGLSFNSIRYYTSQLKKFQEYSSKSFIEMNSSDIKEYLKFYQQLNNCSVTSLNNTRRILSSFFKFLEVEEKIIINPMNQVDYIKQPKKVRKAFTDEEIELLRKQLDTYGIPGLRIRNKAIFELLLSSGLRLSELTNLKISDISLPDCKGICLGKGNKERIFYFSERTKVLIDSYLKSRKDDNQWLFVSSTGKKLDKSGVGTLLRELGRTEDISNVHPHRFRRTMATRLVRKGMPIEQVSKILGHSKLSVTMRYVETDKELLKLTHQKHTN